MARPLRVNLEGGCYHVTARGVGRMDIFVEDDDRRFLLSKLGDAHQRWGVLFHAYCLMTNHIHLDVETPHGELSEVMQWLLHTYASHFNWKHDRVGHLFQGRFKSALVETETYLHHLTRYIHLNPVRAGMVEHPADYPWSSYRIYLGLSRRPPWLNTSRTLTLFAGTTRREQIARYRQFVEAEMAKDPLRDLRYGAVLGSREFVREIERRLSAREPDREVAHLSAVGRRVKLDDILLAVEKKYGVSRDVFWRRGRKRNEARDVAIYLARQYGAIPLAQLGASCGGLGPSAVSLAHRRIAERMTSDDAFRDGVTSLIFDIRLEDSE